MVATMTQYLIDKASNLRPGVTFTLSALCDDKLWYLLPEPIRMEIGKRFLEKLPKNIKPLEKNDSRVKIYESI